MIYTVSKYILHGLMFREGDIDMEEKRREKRLPIDIKLEVTSLFHQDNAIVENIDAPIEVTDISKSGIGFRTGSILPVDYYFNARIQLGDNDSVLYTVVKILRVVKISDTEFFYGCELVGMPSVLHYMFDEYEQKLKKNGEVI